MKDGKQKIILDVDTGADDALAILLAIFSGKFEILGITTVAGNTNVNQATINTLRVLNLAERLDTPVFKGNRRPLKGKGRRGRTQGKDGLCEVSLPMSDKRPEKVPAQNFIKEAVKKYSNEIEIVATGPLTNIAEVFKNYPQVRSKIKRIYIMGGAVERPGNITSFAEFNFFNDPEAVKIVFGSGVPIILVPLDVTMELLVPRDWLLEKYGSSQYPITKFIVEMVNNRKRLVGKDWFYLHDPLALGVAIDKSFVETRKENLSIITRGIKKGQVIKDSQGSEIEWAFGVKTQKFLDYFGKLLLK